MTNDDVHEDRARVIVDAFLQNKSMEQKQDYLARGRRFGKLDVAQLNERLDHGSRELACS